MIKYYYVGLSLRTEGKVKLYTLVLSTLILLVSMPCCAVDKCVYKIDGLNDDIYFALCGVWDARKVIDKDEYEWALFTWGKDKYTQDSIIIDLGYKRSADMWYDPPAILRADESADKILSIEMINANEIKLNLEGVFWDNETKREEINKGFYTIHINDDKSIWIDYHSSKKNVKRVLYKISGPKNLTDVN
jgi:hypothetical protein